MVHLKNNSERVTQMMFQKMEREVTKLIQNDGITEMSITSNYISSKKKRNVKYFLRKKYGKTGIILQN
jgi:hypothetical protein